MTSRSLLSKWLVEYTSPVVVTIATTEVESICLKNGLLLHELLSAFGHLDNLSATVRSVNHQIPVIDAHIRFERNSEVVPKTSGGVEEYLRDSFVPYDITKIPRDSEELKASPPTGWTSKIEQTIMRSLAFSEFEMTSHPLIFLTVVASSDVDHVGCMQELSSSHHIPSCFNTGQYDPDIHRVYLLLHDVSSSPHIDSNSILRLLKSKFSPSHTKLLCINSLPENNPNLQHPDIWSRWKIPLFFPQHAPQADPTSERHVYGSRLSMEDYMSLRTFCIELFQQEILPAYERRVGVLLRQVNEAKKGVRNVLKSFWRKPRDSSSHMKGVARYRFDRIEAQTLLLGDTAFCMRDYDAALSMYRLVKDDFKADKSTLHYAHTNIMIAACQFMLEPGVKTRDLVATIEAVTQCIQSNPELPHASAYYAYILSELLNSHPNNKSPLEAVQILLLAAGYLNRYPILSALLTERAAQYYIPARQYRKYSLHIVLAGHKYNSCGTTAAIDHSSICFAAAMILYDTTEWSTVKSKLWRALADRLKVTQGQNGLRKALLLLLQILSAVSSQRKRTFNGGSALVDAVAVLQELTFDPSWGNITIPTGWENINTRDILLDKTFLIERDEPNITSTIDRENVIDLINAIDVEENTTPNKPRGLTIIEDLHLPEIYMESVFLLVPLNGSTNLVPYGATSSINPKIELLKSFLDIEKSFEKNGINGDFTALELCADKFALADCTIKEGNSRGYVNSPSSGSGNPALFIPLGEKVVLQMKIFNPLPIDLSLRELQMSMNIPESFDVVGVDLVIPSGTSKIVTLIATPLTLGTYRVDNANWFLGERVQIIQHIQKKGPLLQKTLTQRAHHERSADTTLLFNVVETSPLLKLEIGKDIENADILSGEILQTTLNISNEGGASAKNIELIFSHPIGAIELFETSQNSYLSTNNENNQNNNNNIRFIPFLGQSSTAIRIPSNITINSNEFIQLRVWLRLKDCGKQEISILSSYQSELSEQSSPRLSYLAFQVNVLPSIDLSMILIPRHSSPVSKSMILSVNNNIPIDPKANVPNNNVNDSIPKQMQRSGEGSFGINNIIYLGTGQVSGDIVGIYRDTMKAEKHIANPSEKISLYIPIELKDTFQTNSPSNWILEQNDNSQSITNQKVFEMFTTMSYCNHRLLIELTKSKIKILETKNSTNESQPRLISQVRKERNILKSSLTQGENEFNNTNQNLNDSNGVYLVKSDELKSGKLTIGITWMAYWKGKMHYGITLLHQLQIIKTFENSINASIPLSPSNNLSPTIKFKRPSNPTNSQQYDYFNDVITMGFNHLHSIKWNFVKNGKCNVHILFQFYSIHPTQSYSISIESLEWLDIVTNKLPSNVKRKRPPLKGLHWEGKTRYSNILLPPHTLVSIPFIASISRKGVYNIKRFRVTINEMNEDTITLSPTSINKILDGQSLISIEEEE